MYKKPGYVGTPKIIALVRELRAAGMPRKDVITYVHYVWAEHNSDRRYADHTYLSAPRYDEQIILGSDDDDTDYEDYGILGAMRGRYSYIEDDIYSVCGDYSILGIGSVYEDRLIRLLQQLTAEERMVLYMYYIEEYTQRQIGCALGVSENSVWRRIQQIKSRINIITHNKI